MGRLLRIVGLVSTATICPPAPIAKSVSVAVGESETMRDGRLRIVTFPLSAVTVAGYGAATAGFGFVAASDGTRARAPWP